MRTTLCTFLLAASASVACAAEFDKHILTPEFWAEGICAGDFNKDGALDVAYGPFWWAGPEWKERHEIYPATRTSKSKGPDGEEKTFAGYKGALGTENEYSDNFVSFASDFNGDGWTDVLIIGLPGKEAFWLENPQGKAGHWQRHLAWTEVDNESPLLTDITGDGRPEIVCSWAGFWGYAQSNPEKPTEKWKWHAISPKGKWHKYTHGLGVGDVNGDGRLDLLEAGGWWEQPHSLENDPVWPKHDALFGGGGAQMYAYDVNGDGRNDIITSLEAHGYGLAWFEQTNDDGVVGWTKHLIVGAKPAENPQGVAFSQPHALELVDVNGDGLKDIVTGKRFWAHGPKGDPEPNAPAVLYWFELKREGGQASFVAHEIDRDSGVGTQILVGDITGDAKPDILVGNKKGGFVFRRK